MQATGSGSPHYRSSSRRHYRMYPNQMSPIDSRRVIREMNYENTCDNDFHETIAKLINTIGTMKNNHIVESKEIIKFMGATRDTLKAMKKSAERTNEDFRDKIVGCWELVRVETKGDFLRIGDFRQQKLFLKGVLEYKWNGDRLHSFCFLPENNDGFVQTYKEGYHDEARVHFDRNRMKAIYYADNNKLVKQFIFKEQLHYVITDYHLHTKRVYKKVDPKKYNRLPGC